MISFPCPDTCPIFISIQPLPVPSPGGMFHHHFRKSPARCYWIIPVGAGIRQRPRVIGHWLIVCCADAIDVVQPDVVFMRIGITSIAGKDVSGVIDIDVATIDVDRVATGRSGESPIGTVIVGAE